MNKTIAIIELAVQCSSEGEIFKKIETGIFDDNQSIRAIKEWSAKLKKPNHMLGSSDIRLIFEKDDNE
jgi:hypothetical protein